ncbi:MAG: methyltransferase [Candidatus Gracilibacteria bacterium]|jgi:hypothetical protein
MANLIDELNSSETSEEKISEVTAELETFSKEKGILNLKDKVQRGLDPIGILALQETNQRVHKLCEKMGASYDDILKMTIEIQTGGPWNYAAKLKEASDPTAKLWMTLNAVNTIGKEREMDLTPDEFVSDLNRIDSLLDEALQNPEEFFEKKAKQHVLTESQKRFRIVEDVPITEMDNGFIPMAINGYEAGILQDSDGILFVGSKNEISNEIFEKWGLKTEMRNDRGRSIPFFVNNKGEAVAKKLYPGFVIILSRNFDLAKTIVKALRSPVVAERPNEDIMGHKVYVPTSMKERNEDEEAMSRIYLETQGKIQTLFDSEFNENSEGLTMLDEFYRSLYIVKKSVIFDDALTHLIEKKGNNISEKEKKDLKEKVQIKVLQKIDELKYLLSIIEPELKNLPADSDKIMDMAGGAGDLGLALTMQRFVNNISLSETQIVDPVAELGILTKVITDFLPLKEKFKKVMKHNAASLQEAEITPNAVVVAKHPCGDLTDTIIEKWVRSESPMLVIMTCCQDKAKDQPARYDIPQADWHDWCKSSAKTNSDNPKKRAEGMEAMTKLDNARVAYLKRHGFDAKLIQTDQFPKGDVIVAKRAKK